jgi:hypothetical protein
LDAPPGFEGPLNRKIPGFYLGPQVVSNGVNETLTENTRVPVLHKIQFHGFSFDDMPVGLIHNRNFTEIRLPGNGTQGCKLGAG